MSNKRHEEGVLPLPYLGVSPLAPHSDAQDLSPECRLLQSRTAAGGVEEYEFELLPQVLKEPEVAGGCLKTWSRRPLLVGGQIAPCVRTTQNWGPIHQKPSCPRPSQEELAL